MSPIVDFSLTNAAMLALPNGLNSPFAIQHSPFANNGECPFDGDEPGLAELIHRVAVEKGSFRVTDDYAACAEADVILIDVQTPTDAEHVPHYQSLREVSAELGVGLLLLKHIFQPDLRARLPEVLA